MRRLVALEIKHVLFRVPLNVVPAFHMQPHADPYHWCEKHLRIFFPGLYITILGFLSGHSEAGGTVIPGCMSLIQNGRHKRCLSISKQTAV